MNTSTEANQDSHPTYSKKVLVVLGMHRSGTSALTRVLSLCGASLPKELMQPLPDDNETGFWEPDEIVAIHEELLKSAGSSWHDLSVFSPSWFKSDLALDFKNRLFQALKNNFSDTSLFVLKDPRICRLLPLWLDILEKFGARPYFVIPIRNPLEVAASLKRRNGFEPAKSLLLWLQHFLTAERDTRGLVRCFITYDQLLTDWQSVISRIESNLEIIFPKHAPTATAEINKFLRFDLRHHHATSIDLASRPDVVRWVTATFDWAVRASNDQITDPEELDAIWRNFLEADQAYSPIIARYDQDQQKLTDQVNNLTEYAQQKNAQIVQLEADSEANHANINQLRADLKSRIVQIEQFEADLESRTAQIEQFEADLESRTAQIEQFEADLHDKHTHLSQLRAELQNREAQITQTVADLEAERLKAQQISRDLDQQKMQVSAIYNSTSWKISMPVRIGGELLKSLKYSASQSLRILYPSIADSKLQNSQKRNDILLLTQSSLFDSGYYLECNPDVAKAGTNPLDHYLTYGAVEGRDPHPLFDSSYYLESNPDVAEAGINPLIHYLTSGALEKRNPHPLFDSSYYLRNNPDVAKAGTNPLDHYLTYGAVEGRDPHPLFDSSYYLESNPDVAEAGINPLIHYLTSGALEKRNPHLLFDTSYYYSEAIRTTSQLQTTKEQISDGLQKKSLKRLGYQQSPKLALSPTKSRVYAFTSICLNYLPKAQVLARTLKKYNPDITFCLLVAEPIPDGLEDELSIFDEVAEISELEIPDKTRWIFKHTIVEICTAIKGFYLYELLNRDGCRAAFYFDPDMAVFSSLDVLFEKLESSSILLTPHLTAPEEIEEAILDNEVCALRHGVYNLGFLGVKPSDEGLRFATWWRDRLEKFCYDDIPQGLFTDQRWVDLAPAFFEDVYILRHPGCNVATWNFSHRKLDGNFTDGFKVNDKPLVFYHFSGFDSGAQEAMLNKYGANMAAAYELRQWYIAQTQSPDRWEKFSNFIWVYSRFSNGESITTEQRLLYRQRPDLQAAFPNPFDASACGKSYFHWYQTEVLGNPSTTTNVTASSYTKLLQEINPLIHFVLHGANQGLRPNPYFDPDFYLQNNPDVKIAGINPLVHYVLGGASEGRDPSRLFETGFYKEQLPIHKKQVNPISHYLTEGKKSQLRINHLYEPAQDFKKIELLRRRFSDGKPIILMITHGRGGGTDKHVTELIDVIRDRTHCLLLHNVSGRDILRLVLCNQRLNVTIDFEPKTQLQALVDVLLKVGVQRVHIHHLYTHEAYLKQLILLLKLPFDFTVHDYYVLSPNPHLIGADDRFVGEDLLDHEAELLQKALYTKEPVVLSEWQAKHRWLVLDAARVIVPSNDVATRLKRFFPTLEPTLAYHHENIRFLPMVHVSPLDKARPLKIAVIGALNPSKGQKTLLDCAKLNAQFNYGLSFYVVGTVLPEVKEELTELEVFISGPYEDEKLQGIIAQLKIDLIWYISQCPETYSYTLSAGLVSGLPLVVPDLGAFPERVACREWTWVQSWKLTPAEWLSFFNYIRTEHFEKGLPPAETDRSTFCSEQFYEQNYLEPFFEKA